MAQLVCFILSVIFGALAASGIPSHPRFQWLGAAIAFLALAFLLAAPGLR